MTRALEENVSCLSNDHTRDRQDHLRNQPELSAFHRILSFAGV